MSSKHRRGLPRKRPINKRKEAIAEELKGVAGSKSGSEGSVRFGCSPSGEEGVDVILSVDLPEMEKKAVPGAIRGPLEAAVREHGAALRFRSVVVRIGGEALVGSAVKELVKEVVERARPARVVVRRGFGDELVLEAEPPKLEVATKVQGDETCVSVGTDGIGDSDLPLLFEPILVELAADASGKKFAFSFRGDSKPDRELRGRIGDTLKEAGAVRVAIGARVLFDLELLARCQVKDGDDSVDVTIDPAADPAITGEAMETVLPDHALSFAGRSIRVRWKSSPDHGEGDHFVRIVSGFAPERIEFEVDGGASSVVWPSLVEAVADDSEVVLRVHPNGRDRATVLKIFPEEVAALEVELEGKAVVVDWPPTFVVDDEAEACLIDTMTGLDVACLCCSVEGRDREPFLPPPVVLDDEGDRCEIRVDTDLGKPAELVRAAERAMPRFVEHLAGKPVRVVVVGESVASRTLLRTMLDHVAGAGPTRLEVQDHGPVDVMLPPMLDVQRDGERRIRIAVDPSGRDEEQRLLALARELEAAALPKGAVVTLVHSPLDEALVAALVDLHADEVFLDDGTQLYPEILPEPEPATQPEPEEVPTPAPAPTAPSDGGGIRVLARNDEAVPPTVMLAVEVGADGSRIDAVRHQLIAHRERLQRRAVLVVLQQNGADLPVRRRDAAVDMLRETLAAGPSAVLVFRGPDGRGRPHFQVLHSTVRAMPVGATFRDPRATA